MIRLVGASIRGLSHERLDIPCQDWHLCCLLKNGCVLLAVADGAGSALYAHVGSMCALETVKALLSPKNLRFEEPEAFWQGLFDEVHQRVLSALEAEAERLAVELRELATTQIGRAHV